MDFGTREMMIVAAAREIRDGEVVLVGMRLPIMAFAVARLTHAPNAVGVFESGLVRETPAAELLYTMADPANALGAAWLTGTAQVLGLLHGGRVGAGFIGGAEIDRFGNINTSYIGDVAAPTVKLPGSGGAVDIAAMAGRLLLIMAHERKRLVPRVGFVTSPGHLDGGDARERAGLPKGSGPAAVITDRAVLRPSGPDRELHLASWHPGGDRDGVVAETGWPLRSLPDAHPTEPPGREELAALRSLDKDGFWRG